jgi:hypothetical protein
MLPPAPRRHRSRWITHLTALVAAVLQLVLVAAPVAEFRDAQAIAAAAAAHARTPAGEQVVAPDHHGPIGHDETRCPACIARSLHAHLALLAPLPVFQGAERTAMEPAGERVLQPEHPSAHLSRAPPIAG